MTGKYLRFLNFLYRRRNEYQEALNELKREVDIGQILITYGLNFDDLQEQFKLERYQ